MQWLKLDNSTAAGLISGWGTKIPHVLVEAPPKKSGGGGEKRTPLTNGESWLRDLEPVRSDFESQLYHYYSLCDLSFKAANIYYNICILSSRHCAGDGEIEIKGGEDRKSALEEILG